MHDIEKFSRLVCRSVSLNWSPTPCTTDNSRRFCRRSFIHAWWIVLGEKTDPINIHVSRSRLKIKPIIKCCGIGNKLTNISLLQVWSHFDARSCPGSAVGVKTRLDNSVTGFIHTKNISDKNIKNPEDRVKVMYKVKVRICTGQQCDRIHTYQKHQW